MAFMYAFFKILAIFIEPNKKNKKCSRLEQTLTFKNKVEHKISICKKDVKRSNVS